MKLRPFVLLLASLLTVSASYLQAQAPVILAPTEITAELGEVVDITIQASSGPLVYSASGLPQGLRVEGNSIVGTAVQQFTGAVTISATNLDGTGSLTIPANIPAFRIESPLTASVGVNQAFTYQIQANHSPTSFTATGLSAIPASPAFSVNGTTGVITGTPTENGVYQVLLSASNASGATTTAVLSITVGDAPVAEITSPSNIEGVVGENISVPIVTNFNADIFTISDLPQGMNLSGNLIVGLPERTYDEDVTITATNPDGVSATRTIRITITRSTPVITSTLNTLATIGEPYFYRIIASDIPQSYAQEGLSAIGGLTLNTSTGVIEGVPQNTGIYQVLIKAINGPGDAGTGSAVLTIRVGPAGSGPGTNPPQISIFSPTPGQLFEGTASSFPIEAEIIPDPNQEIVSAVAVLVDLITGAEVELTSLSLVENNRFVGNALIGPDFTDRQVSGGRWELQVRAYQTNALNASAVGSESVAIEVTPVLQILFPTFPVLNGPIQLGSVISSALASSNALDRVEMLIQGPGLVQTDAITAFDPPFPVPYYSGIYNFNAQSRISMPGEYTVQLTAYDTNGNTTVQETTFEMSDSGGVPNVQIKGVPQGYVNDVFTPPLIRVGLAPDGFSQNVSVSSGGSVITIRMEQLYVIELLESGAGIYPRQGTRSIVVAGRDGFNESFPFSLEFATQRGRAVSVSESFRITNETILINPSQELIAQTILNMRLSFLVTGYYLAGPDGDPARVPISLEISPSTSQPVYYEIFVNGELIRSGDPLDTFEIPLVEGYPLTPYYAPPAGDYIIQANVRDADGKVGTAYPTRFTIIPTDFPEVQIMQPARESTVEQGDTVQFAVSVANFDKAISVVLRNVNTGEEINTVRINPDEGDPFFRANVRFEEAGLFRYIAVAEDFEGEISRSLPVTVTVIAVTDLDVEFTEPTQDVVQVIRGGPVSFGITATSSAGIREINLLRDSAIVDSSDSTPATFSHVFNAIGTYTMEAQATDIYGSTRGANREIKVNVVETDLSVSVTEPSGVQEVVRGGTVTFTVEASATPGVNSIDLLVDGQTVASSNSVPAVFDIPFNNNGNYTVTARATDAFGNTRQSGNSIAVRVIQPTISVTFTEPQGNRTVVQGQSLNIRAVTSSTFEIVDVSLQVAGEVISDTEEPYDFTYQFNSVGQFVVSATATDSRGNTGTASNPFTVTVEPLNPLIRNGDFVTQTYRDIFYRTPTNTEFTDGVALLDGGMSKAQFVVQLLSKPEEENYTIAMQEYLTMTAEWPNYTELRDYAQIVITSQDVNALTVALLPEYEQRFGAWNTTNGFMKQVFFNKHGVGMNAITEVRLSAALNGPDIPGGNGSPGSPGYNGNVVAYFTQFALDNDPWAANPAFSRLFKYEFPNRIPATHPPYAHAMVGLWRISGEEQVSTAEVNRFAGMSLVAAVQEMLDSPRYTDRFPPVPPALFSGVSMAEDGWFHSDWMGWVNGTYSPWYMHSTLGWLYSESGDSADAWFYSDSSETGWFWTTGAIYPNVYRASTGKWYYYLVEPTDSSIRYFYNYEDSEWEALTFSY